MRKRITTFKVEASSNMNKKGTFVQKVIPTSQTPTVGLKEVKPNFDW